MLLWPNRLYATGLVTVAAGVPTLTGSAGPVTGVTDNGVGDYTLNFRAPGMPGFLRGVVVGLAAVNAAATIITYQVLSAIAVRVLTWDAAGVAAESSFSFSVKTNSRAGGVV